MKQNKNPIIEIGLPTDEIFTPRKISVDVSVLVDTRGMALASSGFGKSALIRTITEKASEYVQVVVIDPEGEYASLREKLDILLVGGENGDLPLDIQSAPLLARKLAETGVSAVIDLYDVPGKGDPWDKRRLWFAAFVNGYMNLPKDLRNPVLMPIDEAHQFAPEGKGNDSATLSRSAMRSLMSAGRKRGICGFPATQRISKIDKDSIADVRNFWVGGANLDLDIERALDMLGKSRKDAPVIRNMEAGEFFGYGPAFTHKGVVRFNAYMPETTHPKAGRRLDISIPKASEKVQEIAHLFGDLPTVAKEEVATIESLKKENTVLKRELEIKSRTLVATAPHEKVKEVEKVVEVISEKTFTSLTKSMNSVEKMMEAVDKSTQKRLDRIETLRLQIENEFEFMRLDKEFTDGVKRSVDEIKSNLDVVSKFENKNGNYIVPTKKVFAPIPPVQNENTRPAFVSDANKSKNRSEGKVIGSGGLRILKVLAQYPKGKTLTEIALLAGYSVSGTFTTYISNLKSAGYIVSLGSVLQATDLGIGYLGDDYEPLPRGEALREYHLNRLGHGEKEILKVLILNYPREMSQEEIASQAVSARGEPYSVSGTFTTYISNLKTKDLITGKSLLKASDTLFD